MSLSQLNASDTSIRWEDKIRIREAIHISNVFGDEIWPDFSKPPFILLFIDNETEYLIHHPHPDTSFQDLGYDSILKTNIFSRPRVWAKALLAAFPAVNGLSTIVVGTPENTKTKSTQWIIKVLHERLHQCQQFDPDYFKSLEELNLSNNDQSGRWMLDFPFPYDDIHINEQYQKYSKSIAAVLKTLESNQFKTTLKQYLTERKKFAQLLTEPQYRYFSFQIWQEGLARYTEYKFFDLLKNYTPSSELAGLPDFISFKEYQTRLINAEYLALDELTLSNGKRVCFYTIGYGEGRILDQLKKNWRKKYYKRKFYVELYDKRLGRN